MQDRNSPKAEEVSPILYVPNEIALISIISIVFQLCPGLPTFGLHSQQNKHEARPAHRASNINENAMRVQVLDQFFVTV